MFYKETSGTNSLCIVFDGLSILVYGSLTLIITKINQPYYNIYLQKNTDY